VRAPQVSYLKTSIVAVAAGMLGIGCLVLIAALPVLRAVQLWLSIPVLLVCCASALVVLGGGIVLLREHRMATGAPDLFLQLNRRCFEPLLARTPGPRGLARLRLGGLKVGDEVEVRSLAEIRATLDAEGCLDGLPFQTEMAAFCGRRFVVYRVVDKIYDYRRTSRLRRVKRAVALAAVRCSGADHGGCQAQCSLIWKEDWVRRVGKQAHAAPALPVRTDSVAAAGTGQSGARTAAAGGAPVYRCQLTQLHEASSPLSAWDIRQDLRSLFAGNVTVAAFCVALLTQIFMAAQVWRGGVPYPPLQRGTQARTPGAAGQLAVGQQVRVVDLEAITATLDPTGRNRGLWFDRELVRHCGKDYRVTTRIDRLIDVLTGEVLQPKTPSFILEDVTASGEFLRNCPQHEYNFWRELWLKPEPPKAQ
jgi:hypothetical protein